MPPRRDPASQRKIDALSNKKFARVPLYDALSIWDITPMSAQPLQSAPLWARLLVLVGLLAILFPFVWAAWALV